ncbi:glycosyltransferase family 22 protein [Favolaschia claudopus]|uniref:Glycosyltransferase family 22 protein n=1 Tax=Favolaschia claudopus TaxID=2862362 RepID=A0AAW0EIM1_9AGAR
MAESESMSDASSLTDLSDEDVEMTPPEPPVSAKRAYNFLLPLLEAFRNTTEGLTLPVELRNAWTDETTRLTDKAKQKPYKVAIVGKSTLLNALLNNQVLTASASGACTAVTTEISYKDVRHVEATVEFISREDWEKNLRRYMEDVTDTTEDTEEGLADTNFELSLKQQSRNKIIGDVPTSEWDFQELMNDPLVSSYLGASRDFSASGSSNFQKELSVARQLWPLVKIVKIMGRFEVVSTGVVLVDLPGYGDVDNSRDTMAEDYLKNADCVCLGQLRLSGIARAKDDRDIHKNLYNHLSRIILDGRVQDKSILLVLTGADTPISSTEITLSKPQQATKALALGQEIEDLCSKKEKKEKSKSKNLKKKEEHINSLKLQISDKRGEKDTVIRKKNGMLAKGRSDIVENALQDSYRQLHREITKSDEEPTIPIFCLGDGVQIRQSLARLVPDPSNIFTDKEHTNIPRLRRYLENDGEKRSLADAIETVGSFCQFLTQTSKSQFSGHSSLGDVGLKIHHAIAGFDSDCKKRLDELLNQIRTDYASLGQALSAAVSDAQSKSDDVFQSKESFKWNRYRYTVVNNKIPLHIDSFCDDIDTLLTDSVTSISPLTCHSPASLRRALGIESFKTELKQSDLRVTRSAQRQGSRGWEPLMKILLESQYRQAALEKGPGMYKRMKLNRNYIHNNAASLFGRINSDAADLFEETVKNIESHSRMEFSRLLKATRNFLLGVDEVPAEASAYAAAQETVVRFATDQEDQASDMLDSLKIRLQEIPPLV